MKLDDSALIEAFGSRPPATFDRAGRVRLLAECFGALMAGELPSAESRLFVAGGALAWLEQGGDLCRDYWEVTAPAGSHHTPAHIWQRECSSRGARDAESVDTITASIDDKESSS